MKEYLKRLKCWRYTNDRDEKREYPFSYRKEKRSVFLTDAQVKMAEWMTLNLIHDGYIIFEKGKKNGKGIIVAQITVQKDITFNELCDVKNKDLK